ncbi:kinase-like domain-containing protein [Mycena epipterygia]|nr:kinase-like domain-containing protein [Mycena epipterygia]
MNFLPALIGLVLCTLDLFLAGIVALKFSFRGSISTRSPTTSTSSGTGSTRSRATSDNDTTSLGTAEWVVYGSEPYFFPPGFTFPTVLCPSKFRQTNTELGAGGFGSVFQVWDNTTEQHLAVKQMIKSQVGEGNVESEIIAQRTMHDCEGFPKLWAAYEDAHKWYLVMDCAEKSFLDIGILSLVRIHALHTRGIIHRDIKPDNLLLTADHNLLVADFGPARITLDQDTMTTTDSKCSRTECGTPDYMVPEVVAKEPYSFGVDYWSMGIVILHWITISHENGVLDEDALEIGEDFLLGVLAPKPEDRFSVSQMKAHAFFAGLDFDELDNGNVPVPPNLLPSDFEQGNVAVPSNSA